jgi:hypothetical protein
MSVAPARRERQHRAVPSECGVTVAGLNTRASSRENKRATGHQLPEVVAGRPVRTVDFCSVLESRLRMNASEVDPSD